MKAVFDTNVLIAAFLTEGVCSKLLARARRKEFQLCICPFLLQEFERVLTKKLKASAGEKDLAVELLLEAVQEQLIPTKEIKGVCRDKDDDHVLSCAVEAQAGYLVTGDEDLLILNKFQGVRIITPRKFELLFDD
jgi:putative PIN family toxin of toxin-antitoxin system